MRKCWLALLCSAVLCCAPASADVKPSALFSDHMVLPSGMSVPIWGTSDPGEKVIVSFHGQNQSAITDADGKWMARLHKLKSSGPFEMTIAGMLHEDQEIAAANYPEIRMFTGKDTKSYTPQSEIDGKWLVCTPETVPGFSAVGYLFARVPHRQLGRPLADRGTVYRQIAGTQGDVLITPA